MNLSNKTNFQVQPKYYKTNIHYHYKEPRDEKKHGRENIIAFIENEKIL